LNRRSFLGAIGCGFAQAVAAPLMAAPKAKPNFVFILIDDMGWRDLTCFGSRFYETPNIDKLAASGMKFTNAYAAAPLCSPTRGSIMTGKYPVRLGMTHITQYKPDLKAQWICPTTATELALDEVTIAEALKPAGYTSACVGKWHLGGEPFYPEKQGFDVNIGGAHIAMPNSYFYPAWKESPRPKDSLWGNVPLDGRPGEYLTDRLTDEALKFIEAKKDDPFFLYLAHYAVHIPLEAKKEKIAKYEAKIRPDDPQNNAVYAAMIESIDEGVGRITAKLEELGIADRTIIFLMSDNGGVSVWTNGGKRPPSTSNLPLRNSKGTLYEGGIREPMIVRWRGVVKAGTVCDTPVISNDFFPTMLEMAGVKSRPTDGLSLMPLLTQKGPLKRDTLYWHYPHPGAEELAPHGAVRQGDWKLVEFFEDGHAELYNLADDIGEKNDLAAKMPKRVAELREKLHRWQASVGAKKPRLNPDFIPEPPKKS
jgi:arylsulfatase A